MRREKGAQAPQFLAFSPHSQTLEPQSHSPSREHLVVEETPVGEGRETRSTGRSLRQESQGVDLVGPTILDIWN